MPPFLVHLVFHPASKAARAAALALHRALNADSALPGLTVPTVLLAEDGSGFPPLRHDLDQAEHSAVIVLADDEMVIEKPVPAGYISWPAFVAGIAKQCRDGKHRFLPVQLSENVWPVHDDLKSINFIRAFTEQGLSGLERRIVVELCRFLLGDDRGTRVPITVFLSHAKQDIDNPPTVFSEMVDHLKATQPVSAWVDSAQIDPGGDFSVAIEEGVRGAAVLALLTSHYSSRPWCRREILFAKKFNRPLVVVDALDTIDLRAFPYMGNVATVAWSKDGARKAVDLLLKEQLRHLHVRKLLERAGKADVVLTSPPELGTVISLAKGGNVLYPDPPLGDEEIEVLKVLDLKVETPLQRAAASRPIGGRKIAVSISEADAPERPASRRLGEL
jgi:TIR domain